jgi:hypothetical protein
MMIEVRAKEVTLGSMRSQGVRGLPVRCSACAHSVSISADQWPDDLRLSNLEPHFFCQACATMGPTSGRTLGQKTPVARRATFSGQTHVGLGQNAAGSRGANLAESFLPKLRGGNAPLTGLNFWLTGIPQSLTMPSCGGKKMWIDFAAFLIACQALTFGIILIVEAIPLI